MRIDIDGHAPQVHPTAWIAENATVIGRVHLDAEVGIWYSAVLRGDTEQLTIGARSNIQDGCVVHADPGFPVTVGSDVSVGHNAILHGCTIADGVLIGMGATVLNGATIGTGSLIAANALIPQNTHIPPGRLVAGVPGQVRRTLSSDEQSALRHNAEVYLAHLETHRSARIIPE